MSDNLIYKKMIDVLKDVETIGKNKKNTQQNYSFRGIDDMYNALHGLFAKHEIFITSEVLSEKREERASKSGGVLLWVILDVKFTFYATDGSSVYSITKGEAMDSGDKASNKAMSTALKYTLMQTFLIPTEEKLDTEYENPEPVKKDTPKKSAPVEMPVKTTAKKTPDEALKFFEAFKTQDKDVNEYFQALTKGEKWTLCNACDWIPAEIDAHIIGLLLNKNDKEVA